MDQIRINVGGVYFETRVGTLTVIDSFFRGIVDCSDITSLFIDRDPTHFRHILNFMRQAPTFPQTVHGLEELIVEMDFYSLPTTMHTRRLEQQKEKKTESYYLARIAERV